MVAIIFLPTVYRSQINQVDGGINKTNPQITKDFINKIKPYIYVFFEEFRSITNYLPNFKDKTCIVLIAIDKYIQF